MSSNKKTTRAKFWMVVMGLFLVIGLVAGGTYILNDEGLISVGEMGTGEMPNGPRPELAEGESMPARPDGEGGGTVFNSQALLGVLKVVMQIVLVVIIVAGSQWLYAWLVKLRRRPAAR